MSEYTIRPLAPETWDAFARLCEKAGLDYERPKGKNHCVIRKIVPAA
jgi:hypothetical protein